MEENAAANLMLATPSRCLFLAIDLVAQYLKDMGNEESLAKLSACSKYLRNTAIPILYRHIAFSKPRWLYYFKARKIVPFFWKHVEFINLKGHVDAWFWESILAGKTALETDATIEEDLHRLFPHLKAIYHKGTRTNSCGKPIYSVWVSDRNVCQGQDTDIWTHLLPIVFPTRHNARVSMDPLEPAFPSALVSSLHLVDIPSTSIWYHMQQVRDRMNAMERGIPLLAESRPPWVYEEDARIESWEDVCFASIRLLTHPNEEDDDRPRRATKIFYLYRQLVKACKNFDFKLAAHEFDDLNAWLETIEECANVGSLTPPWDLVVWFNYPVRLPDWTRVCLAFQTEMIAKFAALRKEGKVDTVLPYRIDLKTPSDPTRPMPNCLHLVLRLGPGGDARYAEINYCVPERMVDQVYIKGKRISSTA